MIRTKLRKLPPKKRNVVYTTYRASPTSIHVMANGSEVVLRVRVPRNDYAIYECSGGWLVEVTSPTEIAREQKRVAEQRAAGARVRAAAKSPAFRALVVEMTAALGEPDPYAHHGVEFLLFRTPRKKRLVEDWPTRARAAGGAAALFDDGRALALIAGPLSGLTAAFWWDSWITKDCRAAIDALDRASTAQFAFLDTARERFELTLARVPKNVEAHARRLAAAFAVPTPARVLEYTRGLRRRRLLIK